MINVRLHLEKALAKAGIEILDDRCGCWIAAKNGIRIAGPGKNRLQVVVSAVTRMAEGLRETQS